MSSRPFRCSTCTATFVSRHEQNKHKKTCGRTSPQRDRPPRSPQRGFVASYAIENTQSLQKIVQVCASYNKNPNNGKGSSSQPAGLSSSAAAVHEARNNGDHDHALQPLKTPNEDPVTPAAAAYDIDHMELLTEVHVDAATLRVAPMFPIDDPQNLCHYSHQAVPDLALAQNNTYSSNPGSSSNHQEQQEHYCSDEDASTLESDDNKLSLSSQDLHDCDEGTDNEDEDNGLCDDDDDFDVEALAAIAGDDDDMVGIPSNQDNQQAHDEQQVSIIIIIHLFCLVYLYYIWLFFMKNKKLAPFWYVYSECRRRQIIYITIHVGKKVVLTCVFFQSMGKICIDQARTTSIVITFFVFLVRWNI